MVFRASGAAIPFLLGLLRYARKDLIWGFPAKFLKEEKEI
jgi:hypothetical protein